MAGKQGGRVAWREENGEPHLLIPLGAPLTIERCSLYDLDFFWMSRTNRCNLDKDALPGGVGAT